MKPIIDEIKHLSDHGIIVKNNNQEISRSKVHLLLASGDLPAVAQMAHLGSHNCTFGCRICETIGKSADNRSHGMYFEDSNAPLRPKDDFLFGNPVSIF